MRSRARSRARSRVRSQLVRSDGRTLIFPQRRARSWARSWLVRSDGRTVERALIWSAAARTQSSEQSVGRQRRLCRRARGEFVRSNAHAFGWIAATRTQSSAQSVGTQRYVRSRSSSRLVHSDAHVFERAVSQSVAMGTQSCTVNRTLTEPRAFRSRGRFRKRGGHWRLEEWQSYTPCVFLELASSNFRTSSGHGSLIRRLYSRLWNRSPECANLTTVGSSCSRGSTYRSPTTGSDDRRNSRGVVRRRQGNSLDGEVVSEKLLIMLSNVEVGLEVGCAVDGRRRDGKQATLTFPLEFLPTNDGNGRNGYGNSEQGARSSQLVMRMDVHANVLKVASGGIREPLRCFHEKHVLYRPMESIARLGIAWFQAHLAPRSKSPWELHGFRDIWPRGRKVPGNCMVSGIFGPEVEKSLRNTELEGCFTPGVEKSLGIAWFQGHLAPRSKSPWELHGFRDIWPRGRKVPEKYRVAGIFYPGVEKSPKTA
nr:hypothetical protein CFP56_56573 [Quercus suber]